jgi:hypothetical protein
MCGYSHASSFPQLFHAPYHELLQVLVYISSYINHSYALEMLRVQDNYTSNKTNFILKHHGQSFHSYGEETS